MTTAFYEEPKEHPFILFAKWLYLLLLGWYLLVPFPMALSGPRFTVESLNCLVCLIWLLSPFLMLVVSLGTLSVLRFLLAGAISLFWIPFVVFNFYIYEGLITGITTNTNPLFKPVEVRNAAPFMNVCAYDVRIGDPSDDYQRTFETHFFPGLKWVEIRPGSTQ